MRLLTSFSVVVDIAGGSMSVDKCGSPPMILSMDVNESTHDWDVSQTQLGQDPNWCNNWGKMGFPSARPRNSTLTLRSSEDPFVVAQAPPPLVARFAVPPRSAHALDVLSLVSAVWCLGLGLI